MKRHTRKRIGLFIVMLLATVMTGCGTGIPSGHRGVFFSRFGDGTEFGRIYNEGFNFHAPWNSIFIYKTQLQEQKEDLTLLSSDGATIGLEVSVLYRPISEKLDSLQYTIGPNYYQVAVAPNIRAIAREIGAKYTPEEIYATKREQMTTEMFKLLAQQTAAKYIVVENVLVRNVSIPEKISEAINFKLSAAQDAQKMEFTLQKEKLEADRKRIEAQGIADFQKIVSAGLSPALLKWKGIEATERLASSPNTKVVIVGNDAGGLPIILSSDK